MKNDKNKEFKETILKKSIQTEVENMYRDYAIETIKERAIPHIVDGLKPVHRKALYTMFEMGLNHTVNRRKVNTIAGATLKYSVHGDVSVQGAINGMTAWFKTNIPFIDGQGNFGSQIDHTAANGRYCCTGDTMVFEKNMGLISHSDLAALGSYPDAKGYIYFDNHIQVKGGNGEWVKCHKMIDSGVHSVIEVTLANGYKLKCTPNHPVKVASVMYDDHIGGYVPTTIWKRVDELTYEDSIVTDACNITDDNISEFDILEAKFLGSMISEGYIRSDKRNPTVGISNTDIDMLKPFLEFYNLTESYIKPASSTNIPCYEVSIQSYDKRNELLEKYEFGCNSYERRIPSWVFAKSKQYKAILLKYLFEGDGSPTYSVRGGINTARIKYSSVSTRLTDDVLLLLSEFGIEAAKYKCSDNEICVNISQLAHIKKFINDIGFLSERKRSVLNGIEDNTPAAASSKIYSAKVWQDMLKDLTFSFSSYSSYTRNFTRTLKRMSYINTILDSIYKYHRCVRIKNIQQLPEKQRVYSLVIDHPTHAYITNGILSHNTEVRLSEYSDNILLGDLNKGSSIVPWSLNYDDTLYEPDVLPAKIPSLLVNGSPKGMAVGYASSHVPHNPIDVINTTIAYINNRDISLDDMVSTIKGPDFPTGGVINGMESVYRAYTTGKGSVLLRGKWKVREERGHQVVSIYEIPFGVTTPVILTGIAKLADEGKIKLVKGTLHDHSDINGINIEFFIKKDEDIDHVMNNILKNTELESRVPISAYVINSDNTLKLATLKDIVVEFISAREEMLHNKFKEEIDIKNKRIHLLNGLVIISKDMDNAISIIRKSKGKSDARDKLMKKYKLDTEQADYILNMAVYRLSSIEIQSIIDDVKGLEKRVKELMAWTKTKSNKHIDTFMIKEMSELKETLFKDYKRRTKIQAKYDHINNDEIIRDEPVTLVVTKDGYVKKFQGHTINLDADTKSFGLIDRDEVYDIIRTSEAKTICVIADRSHVFGFKVHSLDLNRRGKLLRNIVMSKDNENVLSWWEHKPGDKYDVITVSDSGMIKSTQIDDSSLTVKGKLIMDIGRKGILKSAIRVDNNSSNLLSIVTKHGQILTMNHNLRNTGMGGLGVIGIKLKDEDMVAGATMFDDKISVVTRSGLYKTIDKVDLPIANRGGFGVIVYNNSNDDVVGVVNDTIERYVVRCGNGLFYDFYMGSTGKRNMKSRKIQLPSNTTVNKIIQWR